MGKFILKRKLYTVYDETDNLKRMKDSDILAEQEKKNPGYGSVLGSTLAGAVTGGAIGATVLGTRGLFKRGASFTKGLKSGGKIGLLAGGAIAATGAMKKRNREVKDNNFYNDRLRYAQKQAKRREAKDWKQNTTQREGYSF